MIRTRALFIAFATLALVACASGFGTTPLAPNGSGHVRTSMSTTPTPSPPPGLGGCINPPTGGTWWCWSNGQPAPSAVPSPCANKSEAICDNLLGGATFVDPTTGASQYLDPNVPASGPGVPSAKYRNYVNCVKTRVLTDLRGGASYNITPGSALASINNVAINTSVPSAASDDMADGLGELVGESQPYEAVYLLQEYGASNFSSATQQTESDLLGPSIDYEDHYCSTAT